MRCIDTNIVNDQLYVHDVMENYTRVWHGESGCSVPKEDEVEYGFDFCDGPHFAKMVEDVYREYEDKPNTFAKLLSDTEKPLFSGCHK